MIRYSPGEYHLRVPRDRVKNLKWRLYVLRRCREDVRYRAAVFEMCRRDIIFFVNTFVWQFNPNAIGDMSTLDGPFVTWAFQDRAIRTILGCIADRTDLIIEKSREMGASWLCLIIMLWFWLFHPMSKFLCVSRNAKAVDDHEDSDSLFWKIEYIIRLLPEWMTPDHTHKVMSFSNLENGSQITGQASTGKAGVGGRALAIFVDEFSQIREAREVYDRTSDTSGCRIFNGTHKGTGTMFHELTMKAESSRMLRKLVMHWSEHPDKANGMYRFDRETQRVTTYDTGYSYPSDFQFVIDGTPTGGPHPGLRSPWYDAACQRKGSARGIAADLDINPTGSVEQVFDAMMIHDRTVAYGKEPRRYEIEYDRETAEPKRLHPKADGQVLVWGRIDGDGKPPRGTYAFGCDIAQGTGATPSCMCGADAETGQKVFEFASPTIEPKDFAYLAVAVCRLYGNGSDRPAKLAWEVPGPGQTFGKHVVLLGHRNMYYRTTEHRIKREVSDTPGWTNAPDSMLNLILSYRDALRSCKYLNPSKPAMRECLSFVYGPDGYVYHTGSRDTGEASGARVNHGDRVVADALCWKLIDEMGRLARTDVAAAATNPLGSPHMTLALRRQLATMGRTEDDLLPE